MISSPIRYFCCACLFIFTTHFAPRGARLNIVINHIVISTFENRFLMTLFICHVPVVAHGKKQPYEQKTTFFVPDNKKYGTLRRFYVPPMAHLFLRCAMGGTSIQCLHRLILSHGPVLFLYISLTFQ
jgi:hypothetical protein